MLKNQQKVSQIYINEHKLQNFLIIFQELVTLIYLDDESPDSEDGTMSLLLGLAKQIQNLLVKDIYTLKFPAIMKKTLKTLKALLNLLTTAKKSAQTTSTIKKQENNDDEN